MDEELQEQEKYIEKGKIFITLIWFWIYRSSYMELGFGLGGYPEFFLGVAIY